VSGVLSLIDDFESRYGKSRRLIPDPKVSSERFVVSGVFMQL